jgi:hypothetical protein
VGGRACVFTYARGAILLEVRLNCKQGLEDRESIVAVTWVCERLGWSWFVGI